MQEDEIQIREESPLVRRDEADRLEFLEKYLIRAGAFICGKDGGRRQEELGIGDVASEFAGCRPYVGSSEPLVQRGSLRGASSRAGTVE